MKKWMKRASVRLLIYPLLAGRIGSAINDNGRIKSHII